MAGDPYGGRAAAGGLLIEIVVALGLFAALVVLGLPMHRDFIASQQLDNEVRILADTLSLARSEAIRHGARVNVCKSADGVQCTDQGYWDAGFLMYTEDDGDGSVDAGEVRRRSLGPAQHGVTIRANRPVEDYVSYTSLGHARMLNGALQMGTFTVCKPGQLARHVVLANSGRVRVDRTKVACP
jgi:type IV fimbrial biogenesis protein FimT